MKVYFHLFLSIAFCFQSMVALAQKDSVIFKKGGYLIGEIQEMDRGVLTMETDFSDKDFKIEWDKIIEIYTKTKFLISLTNRQRYNGSFKGKADSIEISTFEYGKVIVKLNEIVYLKGIDDGFKDRFFYSIDIGLSATKANNLKQFSTSSRLGYTARKWTLGGTISSIVSDQDSLVETKNTDGSISFRYILHKGWFVYPEIIFLSNTEQNLDLRTTTKLGAGNYILRTNSAYWTLAGGVSRTLERFSGESEDRNSWEAFFGTDLNLFDIGDLNFLLKTNAYPSLTEKERFRLDANFEIKYDLPFDFYIKLGTTYNFDNQPADGGSKNNYTLQTGIGWEY